MSDNKNITNKIIQKIEIVSFLSISYKIPPTPINDINNNIIYLCFILHIIVDTL